MSLRDCIVNGSTETDANGNRIITDDQSLQARTLFDELEAEYLERMSPGQAAAQAGRDTFDALKQIALEKKRKKLLQVQAFKNIDKNLREYKDFRGRTNYGKAAEALFEQDNFSRYSSVTQRADAIHQAATAKLYNVLATFRRNLIGETRNKAQLKNMVREIFGKDTGDASAKEFAQAWKVVYDDLRLQFNRAGGSIPYNKDAGMPQVHDQIAVGKVDKQEWIRFISDRLDAEKMIDEGTGLSMSSQRLELALNEVYDTIATGGYNKVVPGARSGMGKSVANRRTDHRFLIFKDADAWIEYQEKFGNANPFDTMMSHISSMSKEIAQMEILGPNPTSTVNYIKETISKEAALSKDPKTRDKARSQVKQIELLYNAVTGKSNAPVSGFIANTFAGLRSLLQSAQLGAATLSAVTDLNFQRLTRSFVGIPQASTITDVLKFLNPLAAEEKGKLAVRLGLMAEGWTTIAAAQMRYLGEISGPEITRRIGDFVMRASFLSPWTTAGRWAFGTEFLGHIADQAGRTFKELDGPLRNTFERYGIGSDKWDLIRSTEFYEHEGSQFFSADNLMSRTDIDSNTARDLGLRVLEMINTETNFAVPSTSLRGRVALTGDTAPGTISGELTRSFAMYKNFGATLVNTHIARGLYAQGVRKKGTYLADFLISATIMGALAIQMKEVSKGRDPRPMTTNEFWTAALLQGGGLGIFGDFLFSDVNRVGGGLSQTIAGPVVGLADDIRKLTIGNVQQAAGGDDTNFASEFIRFAGRYTPGSSLWYTRLALERNVIQQLQIWADPKAYRKFRSLRRRYAREYNQDYWWEPGETTPRRSPEFGNLFEEVR